jgi:hypothetical protein
MTIYSKEMKITISGVEDAIKGNREDCTLLGGNFNGSQRKGEKYRWNGLRTWMGSIEWKRTRG